MNRFGPEEEELVLDVLHSGDLSPYFGNPKGGKYVQQLEHEFADYVGVDYAVAVSNGTSALHTAYLACGIKPADRVVVPAHTFIATASMVLAVGAIPIFVDVNLENYCMDADTAGLTRKTDYYRVEGDRSYPVGGEYHHAIVPVDLLGYPIDMKPIYELAKERGMAVIEDASQALGSMRNGKRVGSQYNDCATWSAQFTKSWTAGEGGMITTNDPKIAEKCRSIRSHGSGYLNSPYLTFNFRMTELEAAVGLAQLRKYPKILRQHRENGEYLLDHLPDGLLPPIGILEDKIFHNMYILGCTARERFDRQRFVQTMIEKGISKGLPGSVVGLGYTSPLYTKPLLQPYAPAAPLPNAEQLCKDWVWLDVTRFKTLDDVKEIVRVMQEFR